MKRFEDWTLPFSPWLSISFLHQGCGWQLSKCWVSTAQFYPDCPFSGIRKMTMWIVPNLMPVYKKCSGDGVLKKEPIIGSYFRKQSINQTTYLHGKWEIYSIMLSWINKERRWNIRSVCLNNEKFEYTEKLDYSEAMKRDFRAVYFLLLSPTCWQCE